MALIKCPECGKEISDKAKNCIHCGYPLNMPEELTSCEENCELHNEAENEQSKKTTILQPIRFPKNKKLIVAFVALFVLVIGIITITSNSFSSEEEYGLKLVDKYQDMLKNPDSLVLRSDVAVISYSRDGKTYKYAFFDASGENSYGAVVTSTACFVNGQYFCDSDEIPSTSEYMSMSDDEAKEYLGLELALAHWKLYGENAAENEDDIKVSYSVDADKIAKKLKIKADTD